MMLGDKESIENILSCPLIWLLFHKACFDDDDDDTKIKC